MWCNSVGFYIWRLKCLDDVFLGDTKFLMSPGVLMLEKLISVVASLFSSDNKEIITFLMSYSRFCCCCFHYVLKEGFFSLLFVFKFSSFPLHIPSVIINPLQQLSWGVMVQQRCMNIFWVINGCWNAIISEHCCYAYFTTSSNFFFFFGLITLRIHTLQRGGLLHIKRCFLSFLTFHAQNPVNS